MSKDKDIITIGTISKEEVVRTIEHKIMPNTLVLENLEPFPGYHGENLPSDPVPLSIFLVNAETYTDEDIIRKTQKIRKYTDIHFSGSPSTIKTYNECYSCIRLWGLKNFDVIPELQKIYMNEGIKFKKKRKIAGNSIIQIRKTFYIKEIQEGIFKDLEEQQMYYLQIPTLLSWGLFHNIIKKIKNNVDNNNFDAALGTVYMKELLDVIRIYTKTPDIEQLNLLRKKIINEINSFYI